MWMSGYGAFAMDPVDRTVKQLELNQLLLVGSAVLLVGVGAVRVSTRLGLPSLLLYLAIGLVIGGTHTSLGCDVSEFNGSILVPGIGHQGGRIQDLPELFGEATEQVLPVVGRGIMSAGPDVGALRHKVADFLANGLSTRVVSR